MISKSVHESDRRCEDEANEDGSRGRVAFIAHQQRASVYLEASTSYAAERAQDVIWNSVLRTPHIHDARGEPEQAALVEVEDSTSDPFTLLGCEIQIQSARLSRTPQYSIHIESSAC